MYAIEKDPREPTDWNEFIKIQDGLMPTKMAKDGESFNYSPRNLGGNVHNDPLFQFYYNAALISFQCGIKASGMTGDTVPSTITEFTQGGGPDVLGAVARGWRFQHSRRDGGTSGSRPCASGLKLWAASLNSARTTWPSASWCPSYDPCTMRFGRGSRT